MGVLNITPDSFSDGGQLYAERGGLRLESVRLRATEMQAAGCAIVDVGGESTRPGAQPVSIEEELQRVIPVVEALCDLDMIISVDTRHSDVAEAAITAGAHMINDVSAGADPRMLSVVASGGVAYALMHMQGEPATMQVRPQYDDVLADVACFLQERVRICQAAGIGLDRLILDPGFGFGKTMAHNLALLKGLARLRCFELPLLVGLSRKSLLGKITGRPVEDRKAASIAAAVLAVERGADILRVHDVRQTVDAIKTVRALADS